MRIEKVQSSDAGSYSCHVTNGVGDELVAHFSLVVKGTLLNLFFGPRWARHLFYPPLGPLCAKHTK